MTINLTAYSIDRSATTACSATALAMTTFATTALATTALASTAFTISALLLLSGATLHSWGVSP